MATWEAGRQESSRSDSLLEQRRPGGQASQGSEEKQQQIWKVESQDLLTESMWGRWRERRKRRGEGGIARDLHCASN